VPYKLSNLHYITSSSSSSLFVQIKIHDAIEKEMIKPNRTARWKNHIYCCPSIEKEKNTKFA